MFSFASISFLRSILVGQRLLSVKENENDIASEGFQQLHNIF